MKNKSLLIAFVLLFWAVPTEAQRFEWVRGYAPGENVTIVGSVVDSVGNLYILGSINFNTCWENGSRLLPIVPHGHRQDNGDVLIAKVSPEGDLVWHKVIHGSFTGSEPHDIKKLGDTAFACLVTMPLATDYYYLYYLDTMIQASGSRTDWPDYPMNTKYVNYECLALITFDFEGNVLEQHFLQMSYLDYNGEDITSPPNTVYGPERWLKTENIMFPSFAIDNEGDIYLSRYTYDMTSTGPDQSYSVEDGTISAIKFWCDRREVGIAPAYSNLNQSPQLLKFSPHFDTLLESRYLFQENMSTQYIIYHAHVRLYDNNIYILGEVEPQRNTPNRLVVDTSRVIDMTVTDANIYKGFLVKMDTMLNAIYCVSLDDSIVLTDIHRSITLFHDIAIDPDSNMLFLCGSTCRGFFGDTTSFYSILTYQGVLLERLKNDVFIISFHTNDNTARILSYGRVPSIMDSEAISSPGNQTHDKIVCSNNRVFVQASSVGGLHLPGRDILWPHWNDWGLVFTYFDYQGNILGGDDYTAFSSANYPGPIALHDSTLYLINRLSTGATFGDIQVPSRGDYFACIAKLTDPAFMSTYERPRDTTICVEVRQEELTAVHYPNPTTGRLTIEMNGRPLREAYVAAMDGVAQPLPVTALGGSRYAADLTGRPDGTYVLVLVADDHRAYRCTVILQH